MNLPLGFCQITRKISTSCPLLGVPQKKKPRMDPILLKIRSERKVKRLENNITKLEKAPKQLIPMLECSLSPTVQKEMDLRIRKETDLEVNFKYKKALKMWALYKYIEAKMEAQCLRSLFSAHEKALSTLQDMSPELWKEAVKPDPQLVPYHNDHIVKDTPPNPDYMPPDGHKQEITKHWKL